MKAHGDVPVSRQRGEKGFLLLALAVIAAGLLILTGATSSTLTQQVRTTQTALLRDARVIAHSMLDVAMNEINYGGKDYKTADGWQNNGTTHTYTTTSLAPGMTGTVTVQDDTVNPIGITGKGDTAQGVAQSMTVTVPQPAAPQPGRFYYGVYTKNNVMLLTAPKGSPGIFVDAYDSTNGSYGAVNGNQKLSVELSGDGTNPARYIGWNSAPVLLDFNLQKTQAEGIVATGAVTVYGKLTVGTPGSDEQAAILAAGTQQWPGYAIYDSTVGGDVVINGSYFLDPRTAPLTFSQPTKDPTLFDSATPSTTIDTQFFGPGKITTYQVCANDPPHLRKFDTVILQGVALVLGCDAASSDPADPESCNYVSYDLDGNQRSCSGIGGDPTGRVAILVGSQSSSSPWALQIASVSGNSSQVIAKNPVTMYMNPTQSGGGVSIGSNGIRNDVLKNVGTVNQTVDPAAFQINGLSGLQSTNEFKTAMPFYGAVYDEYGDWKIQTNGGAVYGAFNARSFSTDGSTDFKLHHDNALNNVGGGGGGGSSGCDPANNSPCLPIAGSFQVLNQ